MTTRRAQHSTAYVAYEPVLAQPVAPPLRSSTTCNEIQCGNNIDRDCVECCGDLVVQIIAQAIWALITGS